MESCISQESVHLSPLVAFCLLRSFSSLQGHRGIGASERALDIGIPRLKLMCQHTDRKRRENCVDNEMLQGNNSHMLTVVSSIPKIFPQTIKLCI